MIKKPGNQETDWIALKKFKNNDIYIYLFFYVLDRDICVYLSIWIS